MDINSNKPSRLDRIWIKAMQIGAKTGCHQMNERSYSLGGYQFPLCARCMGIFIGQLAAFVAVLAGFEIDIKTAAIFALAATFVLGVDGLCQYKGLWVSTNARRLNTGLICGLFCGILFYLLIFGIFR